MSKEKVVCGKLTKKGTKCKLKKPCRFHDKNDKNDKEISLTELEEALPKISKVCGPEDPTNPYHVWLWETHQTTWSEELDRVCNEEEQIKLNPFTKPWATLMDSYLKDSESVENDQDYGQY